MGMKRILAVCTVLALGSVSPTMASAAVFSVNTEADTTVPGGCTTEPSCSLRDALASASASADPEDRVEVPAGRYALTAGELTASGGSLTIHGAGARTTTIDAQGTSRVFNFVDGNVVLEGITVTGGVAPIDPMESFPGDGGGILAESSTPSTVTLNQVTVRGNTASLNGGGIAAPPESGTATKLTINESTIAANRVTGGVAEGQGGGVYAFGDVAITNSTISGNSIDNAGLSQGGGVFAAIDPAETDGTAVTMLNATIAGNAIATGGVGGGFAIENPTAGVATTFNVKNTIIAANTAGGAAADCGAVALAVSANNLSSDASCQFTDPGSRQNSDARLGPLQNNGGPTDTLALEAGSQALDAGTNAGCPPTDQRGVTRPQGPACDIGAFEVEVPVPAVRLAADLVLRLKSKPKRPSVGEKVVFRMKLVNRGPDAANGVVVRGRAPALARKIKGGKVKGKPACKLRKAKRGKRQFVCRFGRLDKGIRKKVKIVVGARERPGKLRIAARARSSVPDPRPGNSRARAVAKVKETDRRQG
jgi:hypothetical protein